MYQTRKYTRAMMAAVEAGDFNNEMLIREMLNYMSEDDVRGMVYHYGFVLPGVTDVEEEEEDSQ
jgi:hypothetical protein